MIMSLSLQKTKQYRWEYRKALVPEAQELTNRYRLHPVVASILANRGHAACPDGLRGFMRPEMASLHDPFLMLDMQTGAERIVHAIQSGEKITVFGDYDADGMTSTALMMRLFTFVGGNAESYVPHRVDEGYGMNVAALDKIAENGTKLLITVDNGITAVEQIRHARSLGMDVVVTDHHQPGPELPEATAVINPNRTDCTYPNPHLVGVGVAFKVAHAVLKLLGKSRDESVGFLRSVLDLVAIGTIADFAPLVHENRVLVSFGLQTVGDSVNQGIRALNRMIKVSKPVTATKIAFQLAPRLNAAGRTSHADICVELLCTNDPGRADEIVLELEQCNMERRRVETLIFEECLRQLDAANYFTDDPIVVLSGENWHLGVVGIVASRVMEISNKPVIILSETAGIAKGSGRSPAGFNLHEALTRCEGYLKTFGGHANAAGLSLPTEDVGAFRNAINQFATDSFGSVTEFPSLLIDTAIQCRYMDEDMMQHLQLMEPFGHCNPTPLLASHGVKLVGQPRVVGTKHLKLQVKQDGLIVDGIGFGMGALASELNGCTGTEFDIVFTPIVNTHWGNPKVEMEIKDLRFAG